MSLAEWMALGLFGAICAALLLGFPVAFTLAGVGLLFAGIGVLNGSFDAAFLEAFPNRLYGVMTNETLIAVPLFVFMGVMLERSKLADQLLQSMAILMRRVPGGLGVAVMLVGALMAASTGIVGATVVTMGLLSLPTMLRAGYADSVASGSICAAGTLGQVIPPSIVLVLLGDVLANAYQQAQLSMGIFSPETVSVGELFAGALLPGLLLVAAYMAYLLLLGWFKPNLLPRADHSLAGESQHTSVKRLLLLLAGPLLLILAVLGSILAGVATPTEAAAVGCVGAILLAGFSTQRRWAGVLTLVALGLLLLLRWHWQASSSALRLPVLLVLSSTVALGLILALLQTWRGKVLGAVTRQTVLISSMVFMILIGATLFSLVFRGFGGDEMVQSWLSQLPGGALGALLIVMLGMFLLGFVLDFIEITYVVVPLVGPALLAMGLDPVWLGVVIALNLQTSFLTPPFGFSLFYLRGVAPDSLPTAAIYRGVVPFVLIQLLLILLLLWLPALATWLPQRIYA